MLMKDLRKKKTLNRCVCPQKNERQEKIPITHGIRDKKTKEE